MREKCRCPLQLPWGRGLEGAMSTNTDFGSHKKRIGQTPLFNKGVKLIYQHPGLPID